MTKRLALEGAPVTVAKTSWLCKCGHSNPATADSCVCGGLRPERVGVGRSSLSAFLIWCVGGGVALLTAGMFVTLFWLLWSFWTNS